MLSQIKNKISFCWQFNSNFICKRFTSWKVWREKSLKPKAEKAYNYFDQQNDQHFLHFRVASFIYCFKWKVCCDLSVLQCKRKSWLCVICNWKRFTNGDRLVVKDTFCGIFVYHSADVGLRTTTVWSLNMKFQNIEKFQNSRSIKSICLMNFISSDTLNVCDVCFWHLSTSESVPLTHHPLSTLNDTRKMTLNG